MTDRIVRCSKCNKDIFYIPNSYTMGIKIQCVSCHNNKPTVKKRPMTLSASYARMKKGIRPDIHHKYSFKSATEANFARILNFLNLDWRYEERAFTFSGYKTKPHVYIMDFEIIGHKGSCPLGFEDHNFEIGYYEVKGYMRPESRKKLRRLKKHYKEEYEKTTVILYNKYKKADIELCQKLKYNYNLYDALTKKYKEYIPEWE